MLFLRIFHSTFSFLQLWNPQNCFWDRTISSNRISSFIYLFFIIIILYIYINTPKKEVWYKKTKEFPMELMQIIQLQFFFNLIASNNFNLI